MAVGPQLLVETHGPGSEPSERWNPPFDRAPPVGPAMSATHAKILILDDDPGILGRLGDVLVSTGYETQVAPCVRWTSMCPW